MKQDRSIPALVNKRGSAFKGEHDARSLAHFEVPMKVGAALPPSAAPRICRIFFLDVS
jgi:hypothetical protein